MSDALADPADQTVEREADKADPDERDDGVGEERAVVAVPDEEADAGAALDHFGRDNRQPAHADTDPEPGEYIGHRRRQHDLQEILHRIERQQIGSASWRERMSQYV